MTKVQDVIADPDELWLKDMVGDNHDHGQPLAQYYSRPTMLFEKGILEIRRAGGLEF
jgi:hypothetical protein